MGEEGEHTETSRSLVVQGDALRLPFPDAVFDKIIASEVMEHLENDRGALAEMFRVLRPGGVLAVTVPAWLPEKICWAISAEYHAPLAPGGHVRVYTERQLRHRLTEVGLEPFATDRTHALHSPYWWLRCLVGPTNDTNPLVARYHDLLVWDMVEGSPLTRIPERLLNPVLGKSMVLYGRKPLSIAAEPMDGADRVAV
jgi:SAM-dependent methyltransferase